jgi:hypothetical protein
MKRRDAFTLLGGAAATWPLAGRAQQRGKLRTIGFLGTSTPVQRLHELGWIENRTVVIEYRWAHSRPERFTEIAAVRPAQGRYQRCAAMATDIYQHRRDPFTCEVFSCNLRTRGQSVQQHGEKQRNVPGHRRIISCHGIHCCVLGARLVAVGLAERARCAPEGFASGRRRSLQRSLPQRSDQSMSSRTLRYGRGRSRPSRQIQDVKRLDVRLQHRRGLVRALCQPDNHGRTMGRDRARWRGQDTRHRGFPPNLKGDKKRTFHANKRTFANIVRRCSLAFKSNADTPASYLRRNLRMNRSALDCERITRSFFAISSEDAGVIYYSRCNFSGPARAAIHCFDLVYPQEEKLSWDSVVTRISLSLRPLEN